MANLFKSVLSAAAALLQSKTVTAGTSNITVSPDAGYDGLSSVTVQPTPSTSITPSNSSPASMTSGTRYTAGGAGYAIASYSNVTPSNSSPVTLSSGSIYKMSGAGKAVASVTNITPSDSSPVAMTSGTVYKASESGYAIKNSPTGLTPNDTSPPSISSDTIYRGGGTGKAIANIATNGNGVTPSANGTYFYSGWNRMTAAGYACTSSGGSVHIVKLGMVDFGTTSLSTTVTFSCTSYSGYSNFTVANNFIGELDAFTVTAQCADQANVSTKFSRSLSYNSSTGVLTVTSTRSNKTSSANNIKTFSLPVYLVY